MIGRTLPGSAQANCRDPCGRNKYTFGLNTGMYHREESGLVFDLCRFLLIANYCEINYYNMSL
jgi:hypothetical protein